MTQPEGTVRRFAPAQIAHWHEMGDHEIRLGPAVEKAEGGPLSAYYARFGEGESAPLPVPYSEVWIVITGAMSIITRGEVLTAGPGDLLHVPENSPGEVRADEDTLVACVSVPAH